MSDATAIFYSPPSSLILHRLSQLPVINVRGFICTVAFGDTDYLTDVTLADVMGERFGGGHEDTEDSESQVSSMTGLSDVPPNYDPGRFYLLALGVFVELSSCINVYFCGRLRHGGTPPLAPPGEQPLPSAYRMVVIAYPPRRIVSGQTRHAIGAVQRSGDPLYLSPEMTGVKCAFFFCTHELRILTKIH